MQRTNSPRIRSAVLFVVTVLIAVTVISLAFPATGTELPEWFPVVGRWIPALVLLAVLWWGRTRFGLEGGVVHWCGLNPGGWRRLVLGGVVGVLILFAIYLVTALGLAAVGVVELLSAAEIVTILLMLPVTVVLFSVSTVGEEVAWRGFLQRAFADRGFWVASSTIAIVWVVFHVPLHGVMAAQGTLDWSTAIIATLALFPLGLLLSALVVRFGSVWPAVFAHALPMTALNLTVEPGKLGVGAEATVAVVSGILVLGAAVLVHRSRR